MASPPASEGPIVPTAPTGVAERSGVTSAFDLIRSAIIEGRLAPGERIIEQKIAAELDLSRTPVREAVRMLTAQGLLESVRNRGAVVRRLDRQEILDLYELRARLESYAAERAADRHDARTLEQMDEGILAFDAASVATELGPLEQTRRVSAANRLIHSAIVEASQHARLAELLANTVDARLVFTAFREFSAGELERSNLFHRLLREAIAAREPIRAGQLMQEHVLQARDQLLRSWAPPEEPG